MLCGLETVMRNDLLRGFNGTQDVRVETQAVPLGCGRKWRLRLPMAQEFVQELNRRDFAVLFAIFPDHTLSYGLYMTIHVHKTDGPPEPLDDCNTSGDAWFLIASIHHGKEQSIDVRSRGFSEHRIPDVPQQLTIRGGASWQDGCNQVNSEVVMEDLKPCQPGNLLGDGQLADRRRSIQQNEFHDALPYRMLLQANPRRSAARCWVPRPLQRDDTD
jgi:hypothetical protein